MTYQNEISCEKCGETINTSDASPHVCKNNWRDDEEAKASERRAAEINMLVSLVHQRNVDAGWWSDPATGQRKDRNVGELLCLVHSEISEALEGHRKNLMDDHLPKRKMIEVELADAIIRIFD